MRPRWTVIAILAAVLLCRTAQAGAVIYTNELDFTTAIASLPAFTNDFTNLDNTGQLIHPLRSGDSNVSYAITTTPALQLLAFDGGISTVATNAAIVISYGGSNLTAIGGLFYCVDTNEAQVDGTLALLLSDGTATNVDSSASGSPQFIGFVSTGPAITSLTISNVVGSGYPALTHLYTVADPPPLIALSTANTVTISWPATPTSYILETVGNLGSRNWSNTGASFQQVSNRIQASVLLSTNAAFFRIKHP